MRRLVATAGLAAALALLPSPAAVAQGEGGIPCPKSGDILIADPDAEGGDGAIIKVNPLNGRRRLVSANGSPAGGVNFENPYNLTLEGGVATDDCPDIFVADTGVLSAPAPGIGDGRIIRVDPETGLRTLVAETNNPQSGAHWNDPIGIDTEAGGGLVVVDADDLGGSGQIWRVDPSTGNRSSFGALPGTGPTFVDPWDVSRESSGDLLVVDPAGGGGTGAVTRVDASTGAGSVLSENSSPGGALQFVVPHGINARGSPLVTDAEAFLGPGALLSVDASSGGRTNVSHNGDPAMLPLFEDPSDVDRKAFSGSPAYVTDANAFGGNGGVISVDTANGNRSVVSENGVPVGSPNFVNPWGIVVVGLRLVAVSVSPSFTTRPPSVGDLTASRTRRGAVIKYTLPERARMVFTIERRTTGRRGRFRCARETPENRDMPACRRYSRIARFRTSGEKGRNRDTFSGRIDGKPLRPGKYRLTMFAIARDGDRSPVEARDFRVVG